MQLVLPYKDDLWDQGGGSFCHSWLCVCLILCFCGPAFSLLLHKVGNGGPATGNQPKIPGERISLATFWVRGPPPGQLAVWCQAVEACRETSQANLSLGLNSWLSLLLYSQRFIPPRHVTLHPCQVCRVCSDEDYSPCQCCLDERLLTEGHSLFSPPPGQLVSLYNIDLGSHAPGGRKIPWGTQPRIVLRESHFSSSASITLAKLSSLITQSGSRAL